MLLLFENREIGTNNRFGEGGIRGEGAKNQFILEMRGGGGKYFFMSDFDGLVF